MTDGFVKIETLFEHAENRNLADLEKVYQNNELLDNTIQKLCADELNFDKVNNKKVLLKPNWVRHIKTETDTFSLCTNEAIIIALLKFILEKKPKSVVIGDAPVQGCNWNTLISESFHSEIKNLSDKYKINITIKDFRRVSFNPVNNKLDEERNPLSNYTIFDVGKKSYLEPISNTKKNMFRVTQYDPDRFIDTHKLGMHKYCIINELFESDIVISMPKVKTHQKAGITAALKNIVGLNGDKDFLPHHRIGGTKMGGDSYPGGNLIRYLSEVCFDLANKRKGKKAYRYWTLLGSLFWEISMPGMDHHLAAAWYGNDTTWRMVMDLNQIVVFGKKDGTLAETPQRFMYSFCDGIIGGQGDGPLKPEPLNLGVLSFSNDSAYTDICLATIMGLNTNKIPLLVAAKNFIPNRKINVFLNRKETEISELSKIATVTKTPPGWVNYEKV